MPLTAASMGFHANLGEVSVLELSVVSAGFCQVFLKVLNRFGVCKALEMQEGLYGSRSLDPKP